MRILVVQESDWLDKGPHQQHHLMERLSLRGYEVRVIDFEITWTRKPRTGFYSKRSVFSGVSKACHRSQVTVIRPGILKLPLFDYGSIVFTHTAELRRQIGEFRPDVIVGFGILNTFIAMRMASRRRIPFIYYLIDALHTLIPINKLRLLGKVLESNTLRGCDVVCVINEELKRYAIEMGAQPYKVHVVRAGIDTERFNPHLDGCGLREKLGISRDDVVLFFMGWLYSFSGLKELAAELSEFRYTYPNLKLVIVGEGDIYHDLQQLKKDRNLQQLILAGWQPYERIPEFIAMADICLLPAHNNEIMRDIVPIKMYEYMACGKPVIATRLPGIMREFGEGNGVIYVERPEDVLKKAVELAGDRQKLRKLGMKAAEYVQKYSWEAITDQFEELLKELANNKSFGSTR